jgi:hypothetical protein
MRTYTAPIWLSFRLDSAFVLVDLFRVWRDESGSPLFWPEAKQKLSVTVQNHCYYAPC